MFLREAKIRVFCFAHKTVKLILGRRVEPRVNFCYHYAKDEKCETSRHETNDCFFGVQYYGENVGDFDEERSDEHPKLQGSFVDAEDAWRYLVDNSAIPEGWRNSGFRTVCYSKHASQWCLSSWIWTSAAIARFYIGNGEMAPAMEIAESFLRRQEKCGGWIVRCDYIDGMPSPILAPNDSCYIAANCLLPLYEKTRDERYLEAAERCAGWCMDVVLPNGLVPFGFDCAKGDWVDDCNIVDIGFTACLFASLYKLTGYVKYKQFLDRFVNSYITLFREPATGLFATCLNKGDVRAGGNFARGQAWALEGLIESCDLLDAPVVKQSIEGIVSALLHAQNKDGSWCYNLAKPLLGVDCKGVSVIAKSLLRWGIASKNHEAEKAAKKALAWCAEHTDLSGECPGGIFSFCSEGVVTHYFYSEAAFVYSSAYALEVSYMLREIGESDD